MTLVNIDLRNQGYETGPDDRVIFYSLLVREGDFGTISTAPVEVELVDGKASVDLAPGPVGVQIIAGQVADTRIKIGEVPPSGPTTLNAVMMVTPAYTPALQAAMIAAITRARDESLSDVDRATSAAIAAAIAPLRGVADAAKLAADASASDAAQAQSSAHASSLSAASANARVGEAVSASENAVTRVTALEAMAGLGPESPVDGQTANLISQPDTLTHAALAATRVDMEVSASQSTATLGPELVTEDGWTLGAGWSGDLTTGFTHAAGDTSILEWDATALPPGSYVVSFDVGDSSVPPRQNLDVTLSDSDVPYIYGPTVRHAGLVSTTSGTLKFAPVGTSPWAGTLTDVSVKEVIGIAPAELSFVDEEGNVTAGVRTGLAAEKNFFAGNVAGQHNSSGDGNTAVGFDTMGANTTGRWNTAMGWEALKFNDSGTRNIAIGQRALVNNRSGYRNTVIGQSAMVVSRTAHSNVAIGADSMLQNITGISNVAVGLSTLASTREGEYNVAVGSYALNQGGTSHSVGVGYMAGYAAASDGNVAVGSQASRYSQGGSNSTLGASAGLYNVAGDDNTLVGFEAGRGKNIGTSDYSRVTAIGKNAGRRLGSGHDDNTLIGYQALANADGGVENTVIGTKAGQSTIGNVLNHNVLIGTQAGGFMKTGADENTIIGTKAGLNLTTGASNILIGYNVQASSPTASNEINIGGVFRGSNATGARLAQLIGDVEIPNLPTTNPGVAGRLWNDAGTLKVSAGE